MMRRGGEPGRNEFNLNLNLIPPSRLALHRTSPRSTKTLIQILICLQARQDL